jgi:broad specificity phosphatase PhoE
LLARRPWDAIYASPLSRARETASIIAAQLNLPEPTLVDDLVERDYGDAEGLNWQQLDAQFPKRTDLPGRETREDVAERVVPALIAIAEQHPGQSVLVVSHGGAIRSVLSSIAPEEQFGMITNGSVHSVRLVDGSLKLIAFDDPIDLASGGDADSDLDEQNALEAREDSR